MYDTLIDLPSVSLRTRILDAGSGPPVLLLHGNPDNADEWGPVIGLLKDRYRCIAPDFPGYGMSPEPPASFTYGLEDQVRFVDAVLDATRVTGKVTLVVHDTGGMAGVAWAARNTARLRGMVVTNTVVFDGFDWFPLARQWADESLYGRLRSSAGMAAIGLAGGALFKRIFGAQCPQLDSAELERFARSFAMNPDAKRTALRQFRRTLRPGFFADFAAMRARILADVPCRVLWGGQDPFIGLDYARAFGSSQVTILPEAGHWVALTAPHELAREIDLLSSSESANPTPASATSSQTVS
jgi:haloalkane dehalogenase